MFFVEAQKMQNMSFSRIKLSQNVIFGKDLFFSKSDMSKKFDSEPNALYFFSPKFDALCFFQYKIWHAVFFQI